MLFQNKAVELNGIPAKHDTNVYEEMMREGEPQIVVNNNETNTEADPNLKVKITSDQNNCNLSNCTSSAIREKMSEEQHGGNENPNLLTASISSPALPSCAPEKTEENPKLPKDGSQAAKEYASMTFNKDANKEKMSVEEGIITPCIANEDKKEEKKNMQEGKENSKANMNYEENVASQEKPTTLFDEPLPKIGQEHMKNETGLGGNTENLTMIPIPEDNREIKKPDNAKNLLVEPSQRVVENPKSQYSKAANKSSKKNCDFSKPEEKDEGSEPIKKRKLEIIPNPQISEPSQPTSCSEPQVADTERAGNGLREITERQNDEGVGELNTHKICETLTGQKKIQSLSPNFSLKKRDRPDDDEPILQASLPLKQLKPDSPDQKNDNANQKIVNIREEVPLEVANKSNTESKPDATKVSMISPQPEQAVTPVVNKNPQGIKPVTPVVMENTTKKDNLNQAENPVTNQRPQLDPVSNPQISKPSQSVSGSAPHILPQVNTMNPVNPVNLSNERVNI